MATIEKASCAGACYGVERALRMVRECIGSDAPTYTLGPLIHNPLVVADLKAQGVDAIDDVDGADVPSTLVIRSHGVVPQVIKQAEDRGLHVVDATCPHVKKAHEAAACLSKEGYQVLVLGEAGHPEVEGILARAGEDAHVVTCVEELEGLRLKRRVGIVVQTTQTQAFLNDVVAILLPRVRELRVFNTICTATLQRQQAAAELASRSQAMVVVGGKNSGNTRRLYLVCQEFCANTHHVETPDELDPAWFGNAGTIGVTAGASTPANQVDGVVARLEEISLGQA
jgi:4-hydroxy-3-methylbut-2-en-1-yl diphosphate reductase